MEATARSHIKAAAGVLIAVVVSAGAVGAAFAAWQVHGPDILVSMVQSGLSWCF